MNAIEQITSLKMRPGAKPGQMILGVDLSETEYPSQVLELLSRLKYEPELRYLELKTGLHVFAVLKHEQRDQFTKFDDAYWMDEWRTLAEQVTPSTAIHLWRGHPNR